MARFLPTLVTVLVLTITGLSTQLDRAAFSVPSPGLVSGKTPFEEAYGKLPLHFEANLGQTDARVQFLARASGYALFLTPSEAVLALRSVDSPMTSGGAEQPQAARTVLRMQLVGANPQPQMTGGEELAGKVNYFIGNDPAKWLGNNSLPPET